MRYLLPLAFAVLLTGCQVMRWSDPQLRTARVQVMKLAGTGWRAETIGDSAVSPTIESTLVVDARARISGHGGCNPYVSELGINSRSIRFGEIFAAEMSCAPERLEQEQRFFSALATARHLRIDQERLLLVNESGTTVLRLARLPLLARSQ